VILLVLIVKHSIPGFHYIIFLYGAMVYFADVTENGILCWDI